MNDDGQTNEETALDRRNQKLRSISENARNTTKRHGPEGPGLFLSPSVSHVAGYEPVGLLGSISS